MRLPASAPDRTVAAQTATGGAGSTPFSSTQRDERRPGGDADEQTGRSPVGSTRGACAGRDASVLAWPDRLLGPRTAASVLRSVRRRAIGGGRATGSRKRITAAQGRAVAAIGRKILRPGKAAITAPGGAAWLKWWAGGAGKAAVVRLRKGEREERHDVALALVVGPHDEQHVLERRDNHQRPDDQ